MDNKRDENMNPGMNNEANRPELDQEANGNQVPQGDGSENKNNEAHDQNGKTTVNEAEPKEGKSETEAEPKAEKSEATGAENKSKPEAHAGDKKSNDTGKAHRFKINRKSLKYGTNSLAMTAIFIAIMLVLNLFVDQLDLKWDLSKDKYYSLTDESKEIVKQLDKDVTIYAFYDTGREPKEITELLDQYMKINPHIKVQYIDPDTNPGLAQSLDPEKKGLDKGSILLVTEGKTSKINSYDLVEYSYTTGQVVGLKTEQKITSSIQYLMSDKIPTVYFITGHGEEELSTYSEIYKALKSSNYTVKNTSLASVDKVPEDADVIVFYSPKMDLTKDDQSKVKEYLKNGGNAVFLFDVNANNPDMPLFAEILQPYNVTVNNDVVVEADSRYYYPAYPLWLIPSVNYHRITDYLQNNNLQVVLPVARSISIAKNKKEGIEETALLTTTESAWGETDLNNTPQKDDNDGVGPLDLAVAVEKAASGSEKASKIVVVGNSTFMKDQFIEQVSPGNMEFFMGIINWLNDIDETASIRIKSLISPILRMNGQQALIVSACVLIVLPLFVIGFGVYVWIRRRHL